MRLSICLTSCLFIAVLVVGACGKRELHMHEKEYEFLQEIEAEKLTILKTKAANLAVRYASKAGDVDVIAEAIVDACAIEVNEVVAVAAEVKSGELGGGLAQETAVDAFQERLQKQLRRTLWEQCKEIIAAERKKKAEMAKPQPKAAADAATVSSGTTSTTAE